MSRKLVTVLIVTPDAVLLTSEQEEALEQAAAVTAHAMARAKGALGKCGWTSHRGPEGRAALSAELLEEGVPVATVAQHLEEWDERGPTVMAVVHVAQEEPESADQPKGRVH